MASRAVSPAAPREDRLHRGLRVDVDRVPAHDPAHRGGRDRRPDQDGDKAGLVPLFVLAVVLAIIEISLTYRRRRNLAFVATDVETRLRNDLYAHLQRLEVGFHDRWQSGQLLSRASSDISVIRRFSGVRRDLPARDHRRGDRHLRPAVVPLPAARLAHDLTAVPVLLLCRRFERRYHEVVRSHPGPDRRPHDGDRGIRQGDPRHQGVRTRERSVRALRRAVSRAAVARTAARSRAHALHLGARLHPEPHARRRAARGCARGRRRVRSRSAGSSRSSPTS